MRRRTILLTMFTYIFLISAMSFVFGADTTMITPNGMITLENISGEDGILKWWDFHMMDIDCVTATDSVTITLLDAPDGYHYQEPEDEPGKISAWVTEMEYDDENINGRVVRTKTSGDATDKTFDAIGDSLNIETEGRAQITYYFITTLAVSDDGEDEIRDNIIVKLISGQGQGGSEPQVIPAEEKIGANTVTANVINQKVMVNEVPVGFQMYNIDGFNYFKLRDVAQALNGTASSFSVDWDANKNRIALKKLELYTPVGGELEIKNTGARPGVKSSSAMLVNGIEVNLEAYAIDGSNYFKLRDLGEALDFTVKFDESSQTVLIYT